jgi:hypothetical protein
MSHDDVTGFVEGDGVFLSFIHATTLSFKSCDGTLDAFLEIFLRNNIAVLVDGP